MQETQSQIRRKGETQVAQDSHPQRSEKTERTEEVAQGVSLGEESNTEVVQGTHPHAQRSERTERIKEVAQEVSLRERNNTQAAQREGSKEKQATRFGARDIRYHLKVFAENPPQRNKEISEVAQGEVRETKVAHSKREVKKVKGGQHISHAHAQARKGTQNEHAYAQTKAETEHAQIKVEQKINEVAHELYPRERSSKINSDIKVAQDRRKMIIGSTACLARVEKFSKFAANPVAKRVVQGKSREETGEFGRGDDKFGRGGVEKC